VAALDGEVFATGDLVRANVEGRAVLTFFDGSSMSVDPGSQVKVIALNRVSTDGIQVTIEQSLGRSWSAVQKLKTPDSRYEVRTPSTTAVVRGTGFLTLVQQLASGGTQTTYQVDEGTLQVTVTADKITIRDPAAGRWGIFMTSPAAIRVSVFEMNGFVGTTVSGKRVMEGPLVAGQMLRSGVTVTGGQSFGISTFEAPTPVTSV